MSFVIFPHACFALTKDLIINGDNLSFDREHNRVDATGSVEVLYEDVAVYGEHLVYDAENDRVLADKDFILSYGRISIEGETLDYGVKNKSGRASKVRFSYRGIELSGREIEMEPERFILRHSSFTSCDLDHPHYRVTASEIVFYPDYGWLVAYWGYFWLGPFPVVPMPTYIYDMLAEEKARKNIPPFPEIGANDEDGTYINERLAWHVRRELSGSYSINYAEKKGFGTGIDADYILSDSSWGNSRVYGNGVDGLWGGITHFFSFGSRLEEQNTDPFPLVAVPKGRQFELKTMLSYRERVNYERVSYYPNIELRSWRGNLLGNDIQHDLGIGLAMISERSSVKLARGMGSIKLYRESSGIIMQKVTPFLSLDSRFYSDGGRWVKFAGGVDVSRKLSPNLLLGLGYLHYFSIDGTSPFNFELYRFSPADRLRSELVFTQERLETGIAASYYLDTWQPEDIDYSLSVPMHCYNLLFKYRSLRREFELGFSLGES